MHVGGGDGGGGGSRRKGARKKRSHGNEEVALQITSMADIFTILLVFLLKSYSVSAINVNVGKDIHLPSARGGTEQVEAMKLEVTGTTIAIEGIAIPDLVMDNYRPSPRDLSREGTIPKLVEALGKERAKQRALASAQGSETEKKPMDPKLLVIADKQVPYKLLKYVLASASMQDYTDFKLVVVTED